MLTVPFRSRRGYANRSVWVYCCAVGKTHGAPTTRNAVSLSCVLSICVLDKKIGNSQFLLFRTFSIVLSRKVDCDVG